MAGITVPIAASADLTDFKRVERQMQSLAKQAKHTGSGFGELGKLAKKAFAIGTVLEIGKKALDEAAQAYQVTQLTNTILRNTGAAAWTSSKAISDMSMKLSNLTGIDDELIQAGSNVILSFGNIRNAGAGAAAIFDRATAASADMGKALGTDTASAARLLGKALSDPVKGMNVLRRAGVLLTNEQQAQIKAMQQRGDLLGAQQVVLGAVEGKFKGAAAAMATPMERLQTMFNNLLEVVGTPIMNMLVPIVQALSPVFSALTPVLEQVGVAIAQLLEPIMSALVPVLPVLLNAIQPLLPSFGLLGQLVAAIVPILIVLSPLLKGAAYILKFAVQGAVLVVSGAVYVLVAGLRALIGILAKIPGIGKQFKPAVKALDGMKESLKGVMDQSLHPKAAKELGSITNSYKGSAANLAAGAALTQKAGKDFAKGAKKVKVAAPKTAVTATTSADQSFTVAGQRGDTYLAVTINGSVMQQKDVVRTIRDELLVLARRQGANVQLGV